MWMWNDRPELTQHTPWPPRCCPVAMAASAGASGDASLPEAQGQGGHHAAVGEPTAKANGGKAKGGWKRHF